MMMTENRERIRKFLTEEGIMAAGLFLLGFFFTLFNFQIRRYYVYLYILYGLLVLAGVSLLRKREFPFLRKNDLNLSFFLMSISVLIVLIDSTWLLDYRSNALHSFIRFFAFYVIAVWFQKMRDGGTDSGTKLKSAFLKGLKAAIIFQLFWILLQFVLNNVFEIDLNEVIFRGILRRDYEVSMHYIGENWTHKTAPSGLTWHSALLAPMFVLGLLLFKNKWIRLLLIVDAFLCRSSTSIVGVFLTVALLIVFWFVKTESKKEAVKKAFCDMKKWEYVLTVLLFIGALFFFIKTKVYRQIADEAVYLFQRLASVFQGDAEQDIHIRYYTYAWEEFRKLPFLNRLFGYGYNTSGFLLRDYNSLLSDNVGAILECDILNVFLSGGILGFLAWYGFLLHTAIRALRVDYRYFIFIIATLIMGAGYNVQWEYVVFIEVMIAVLVPGSARRKERHRA